MQQPMVQLKAALFRRRITQGDLARAVDVSSSRISRILNGRFRARGAERRRIAAFLQVPERRLFPYLRRRYMRRRRDGRR